MSKHPADMFTGAIEEAMRERGHLNVLIAGRTGVGKSTLVNAVFQGKMAKTGQGRPVTTHTREINKSGIPLTIFDTRGLEMADFESTLGELERLVATRGSDPDPNRQIHVAWLCLAEDGRRVEDAERTLHTLLARHVPVLAVITKARADAGFRAEVQRLLPQTKNVMRVRALPEELDDGHLLKPMGLEDLVVATADLIPEARQRALSAAQRASVGLKKRAAHKTVVAGAMAATTVALTPIPFSDVALLAPIQVAMFAGISASFGLQLSSAFLMTLVSSAVGATGASIAGRALVSNLLKLIPGFGSAVGGLISAGTASALTAAVGEAYIATLVQFYTDSPDNTPTAEAIGEAFAMRMKSK